MLSLVRNLRAKIAKTKNSFIGRIAEAIRLRGKVDEDLIEEIEDILLRADTGVEMTQFIIDALTDAIRVEKIKEVEVVQDRLQQIMKDILLKEISDQSVTSDPELESFEDFFDSAVNKPHVIVFVGVNGVGKTTSIGKVAYRFRKAGKSVLIVAGDTFRAAAIEQLSIWADRSGCAIVKNQQGSDPAAAIFDGVQSALAKNYDVVLIDTAGRQHTKHNLMIELSKIDRTIKKLIPDAPHEVLLIVDSTTGQNAISQAKNFNESIKLTGLILSKFDGTAKGGIIFNLKHNLALPVKLIGIGESIEDIECFDIQNFVSAFFSGESESNPSESETS